MMTRAVRFFLALGVGLLVLDGVVFAVTMNRSSKAADHRPIVVSTGTATIGGPFALIATDGKAVTDQTYRGKWMLIYFGYTFCPDACPTVLTNISIAVQTLREEADPIQPLFITVDPKRDTAAVLGEYLKSFDPRIAGLTGSEAQAAAAVKTYRAYAEPEKAGGNGSYLIEHSSYVYLMDPSGKFVDVIEGATPPDQMAEWLRKSMRERATCRQKETCGI
jgi:protein SCO1/2